MTNKRPQPDSPTQYQNSSKASKTRTCELVQASSQGDLNKVDAILKNNPYSLRSFTEKLNHALLEASRSNHPEIVKY